jgi:hypothetical protein
VKRASGLSTKTFRALAILKVLSLARAPTIPATVTGHPVRCLRPPSVDVQKCHFGTPVRTLMLATVRNGRDPSKKTPKIKSDEGESPARKTKRPRDKDPKEKGQHRGKKHRGEDDTGKKS